MVYNNIIGGVFVSRPNRFIAMVEVNSVVEVCHVKNTGRCRELLIPGVKVILQKSDNPERKTKFDLIAVYKGDKLINIDSQAPNKVFKEWASSFYGNGALIKSEVKYKNSRFDFYIEANGRKIFTEVKGVTLENDGVMMFPDAPTERGVKHLRELCDCVSEGYDANVFFIVQMGGGKYFTPNANTHSEFARSLFYARKCGVGIYCVNCAVTENTLEINDFLDVVL